LYLIVLLKYNLLHVLRCASFISKYVNLTILSNEAAVISVNHTRRFFPPAKICAIPQLEPVG
jgi:hypothetical protein